MITVHGEGPGEERDHRPSGRRADAAEHSILDAATELLAEVGYERMSIDAVAERARAGKATIYRHFDDKASLVVAAVVRCGVVEQTVPAPTGSLRGDLLAFGSLMCESTSGFDGALFAGLLNAARSHPELALLVHEHFAQTKLEALSTIAGRAAGRGEPVEVTRAGVASEVATAVVLHRLLVAGEPLDESFLVHLIDDIVIPLLEPASGGSSPSPT